MEGIRNYTKIAGLALLLAGCGENKLEEVKVEGKYDAPVASAGEGECIGVIDWATVQNSNPGYEIDMNNDSKPDYVRLDGSENEAVLYFAKDGNKRNLIPILKMKGQIRAYTIETRKDMSRPSLIYFTPDGKGYIRENLGENKEGIPYFGGEQSVE